MSQADYGLYVIKEFLQNRYPCTVASINASNVFTSNTDETVIKKRIERIRQMNPREITLATAAAEYVKYKGQQYVIEAIPQLNAIGVKVNYLVIGEAD